MVDFQSRDTRRGPTEDEATDESEPTDETDTTAESASDDVAATVDDTAADAAESTADSEATHGRHASDSGDGVSDRTVGGPTGKSVGPAAETTRPVPTQSVAVAVVTVGADGESVEDAVASGFEAAGHDITVRERLRGNYDTVQQVADRLVDRADVDVVVTAGGVGIDHSEITIEAVHPLLEKALPGFGEAVRSLLFERIGTGIVAVRSAAGIANGTFVFCLPGDPEVATLAVEEILVTEAPELVAHLDE